jgi:hypothetical protein
MFSRQLPGVATLALLVAALPVPRARAETYRDAARHYTLELPQGWQTMAADEIKMINDMVNQRMPGKVRYDAGFRPKGGGPGTFPYILVQFQPFGRGGVTYEDIERDMARVFNSGIKKAEGAFSDMTRNISVGSVILDRSRNRLVIRIQADAVGVGAIQALSVGHIGSEGIVLLHGYDVDKSFPATVPVLTQINDSFQLEPEYTFKPPAGSSLWKNVGGRRH